MGKNFRGTKFHTEEAMVAYKLDDNWQTNLIQDIWLDARPKGLQRRVCEPTIAPEQYVARENYNENKIKKYWPERW